MRAGAQLYGFEFVQSWRSLDISELTVLLTAPEADEDGQVRSTRDLGAEQRAYEEGSGPKPEVAPSGAGLALFASQFPGLQVGPPMLPPQE